MGAQLGQKEWPKGVSGNPKGRPPKERGLTDELLRLLDLKWWDSGVSNRQLAAQRLLTEALTGSADCLKYLFDRMEGRPAQALEHSGANGQPFVVKFVTGTDAED